MSDTTPGAAGAADAICEAAAQAYDDDRMTAETCNAICAHAEALGNSLVRLRNAFLRAEARVELWEANQDQTTAIWLQRWGLEPEDLPGLRIGADARNTETIR